MCSLLAPRHSSLSITVLQTSSAAQIPALSCSWSGCRDLQSQGFCLRDTASQCPGWWVSTGGSTAVKALHALEQSGLQAGLSPFGLFHCFLCQGVKLRKIWPGKSKALHSTKEKNSCRIPGTANVNRAPLVFVQLKGWVSPPPGCRTLISLTTVIPPV